MIGLEPCEALRSVAKREPRRELLGEVEEENKVSCPNGVGLARLHQPRLEELAD